MPPIKRLTLETAALSIRAYYGYSYLEVGLSAVGLVVEAGGAAATASKVVGRRLARGADDVVDAGAEGMMQASRRGASLGQGRRVNDGPVAPKRTNCFVAGTLVWVGTPGGPEHSETFDTHENTLPWTQSQAASWAILGGPIVAAAFLGRYRRARKKRAQAVDDWFTRLGKTSGSEPDTGDDPSISFDADHSQNRSKGSERMPATDVLPAADQSGEAQAEVRKPLSHAWSPPGLVASLLLIVVGLCGWLGNQPSTSLTPTEATQTSGTKSLGLQPKPIEEIEVGDHVWSRDPATGELALRRIEAVFHRSSDHLRHLTFTDTEGAHQTLSTTDEHPFFVIDATGRTPGVEVPAGELSLGDEVIQMDGTASLLTNTRREEVPGGVPVYNFRVAGFHTYHVSASPRGPPLWVHNADCTPEVFNITPPAPRAGVDDAFDLASSAGAARRNVNWRSFPQFGHTFTTHGAGPKNTRNLIGRAAGTGKNQGQWLDNQAAAEFLSELPDIGKTASVRIPDGLGRVILPDGSMVNAVWARVVTSPSGYRSAYPIIP